MARWRGLAGYGLICVGTVRMLDYFWPPVLTGLDMIVAGGITGAAGVLLLWIESRLEDGAYD